MRYSILIALVLGTVGILADQPTVTASYTVPSDSSTVTIKYTGPPAHSTSLPPTYHTDCGEHCGGTCGDGVVQSPYEECDLGPKLNATWNSGCSANCTCVPVCGDGKVEGTESCDLGSENGKWNSGCSSTCTCTPVCGNGIKEGDEACDLGADNGKYNSGCSATCEITPICGNGIKEHGEECDAGNKNGAYNSGCSTECNVCGYCGDGIVDEEAGETCDLGYLVNGTPGANCSATCTAELCKYECSNGIVEPGEECDDGVNNGPTGRCSYNCTWNKCSCGNGITEYPEECDDGELNGTWGSHCNTNCTLKEPCGNPNPPRCGNGVVEFPEVCDDGYLNGGEYSNCTTDCQWCNKEPARCGDGHIDYELGETCDDGLDNGTPQSSCTSTCQPCGTGPKPPTACATCNPNPFLNKCTITTSCIDTPTGNDYCACRAGYRADGLDATDARQFRLAFPGQEYRVFVAPGVECNTLCTTPFPGPDSCKEVPVQVTC
ncbi:hypothetical protein BKA65DRAFT_65165 [Rhexocercosporidium sp. MPI-PUGE-AT-0058]|nr:hypothetical protein BKA65DRAFT_65165 [Rhexocercosporidium sp. MPI-PUGE-AT-0058]